MPNRVLRDWTASENIDQLSADAEVFLIRLIMKADDFGIYQGNPKLLKSALFPLRDLKDQFILKCIKELTTAKIVIYYEVEGKKYIKINEFGQRLRKMKSIYPEPDDNARTIDSGPPPETETETKQKPKQETESENVLLLSILDESTLNEIDLITFSYWKLFKQNLLSSGITKTATLDKAKLKTWSKEVRLMIESDGRTIDELKTVFKFLGVSNFWKKNIQSTKKLREKFERLYQEATTSTNQQKAGEGVDPEYLQELKKRTGNG